MKLQLINIGKTANKEIDHLIQMYQKRVARYHSFTVHYLKPSRHYNKLNKKEKLREEHKLFQSMIGPKDAVILLDEKGKQFTSQTFAKQLNNWFVSNSTSIVFLIGGPYGFSDDTRALASASISLSKLTFPHDLARLIFVEQLYRAFTILNGEKYHHE